MDLADLVAIPCPVCLCSFSSRNTIKNHMKAHHPNAGAEIHEKLAKNSHRLQLWQPGGLLRPFRHLRSHIQRRAYPLLKVMGTPTRGKFYGQNKVVLLRETLKNSHPGPSYGPVKVFEHFQKFWKILDFGHLGLLWAIALDPFGILTNFLCLAPLTF